MKFLVTGSAGHLGEALVRTLQDAGREVAGLDLVASRFTTHVGSIVDRGYVRRAMAGVDAVFLTGGSVRLAHVRKAITKQVPKARIVEGDTFGAVGKGLTLEALRRYGPRD